MGKVNVVLWDGTVVSVDEQTAAKAGVQQEGLASGVARETSRLNTERSSGVAEGVKAGLQGAADAVTLGGYGMAVNAFGDEDDAHTMRIRGQERGGARLAGEIAGLVAPTGLLGTGAKVATKLSPLALSTKAAQAATASRGAQLAIEGGIQGVGGYIASTNVTGDPLTIEGALVGAGVGGVLNFAVGGLAERLMKGGQKAGKELEEAKVVAEKQEKARTAVKAFDSSPAYNEARELFKRQQSERVKLANAIERDHTAYSKFVNSNRKVTDSIFSAEQTVNTARKYYGAPPKPTDEIAGLKESVKGVDNAPAPQVDDGYEAAELVRVNRSGRELTVTRGDDVVTVDRVGAEEALTEALPEGFKPGSAVNVHRASVLSGLPKAVDPDAIHVVHPSEFVRRGIQGNEINPKSVESILEAWGEGKRLDPIDIWVKDGKYFIEDGNHRMVAAAQLDREVAVRFREGANYKPQAGSRDITERFVQASDNVPGTAEAPALQREVISPESAGTKKQPITPELAARFKDYRKRISQLYKMKGGKWKVDGGRWARNEAGQVDREALMTEIRQLHADLQRDFPKAARHLRDVPPPPAQPLAPAEVVHLPDNLREFGKMTDDRVAKLSKQLTPEVTASFENLAKELDLPVQPTKEGYVTAVHSHLKGVNSLLDDLARSKAVQDEAAGSSIVGWLRKFSRGAARLAVGRFANKLLGGGMKGAVAQVAAGDAARSAMTRAEAALLDSTLATGREGVRGRVRSMMATYGEKGGRGVEKLRPVTSYLATSFPSGEPDPETDPRKQVVNRINELSGVKMAASDALYMALEPALGHGGDIAFKLHQQVMGTLEYLTQVMPKDTGMDVKMFTSFWEASHEDAMKFAHTLEAVLDPFASISRALSGDGHPAAVDALWNRWPALMNELASELASDPERVADLTYEEASNFSHIFRIPLTPLQDPEVMMALAAMELPPPAERGGAGGSQQPSTPGGRPPRVDSKVAGSSVAGLIS